MSTNGHIDNAPGTSVVKRVLSTGKDDLARFVDSITTGVPLTKGIQTASAQRMTFAELATAELPPVNATMSFRHEPVKEAPVVASTEQNHEFLGVDATLPKLSGKNTRGLV